jgi:hypothetical protein
MVLLKNCFVFGASNATAMNDTVVKPGYDEYYISITTTTEQKSATNTTGVKRNKFYLYKNNITVRNVGWRESLYLFGKLVL